MRPIRWALWALPVGAGVVLLVGLLFALLGRVDRTVEAAGEVQVERYHLVRAQVSGLVSRVLVEPGDRVLVDEPLIQLEDHEFQRTLITVRQSLNEAHARLQRLRTEHRLLQEDLHPKEMARKNREVTRTTSEAELRVSRVEEAKIGLETAQQRRAKFQRLSDLGLVSTQDLEEALLAERLGETRLAQSLIEQRLAESLVPATRSDLEILASEQRRQLAGLAAEMKELEFQIAQWDEQSSQLEALSALHTLRAQIPGVISSLPTNELLGRYVNAGEELLTVIDDASISFVTHVPEQAIVRIRSGQTAYVEIAGLPKQRFDIFRGEVGTVAQEPESQQPLAATLYPVQIQLQTPWITLEHGRFYLRTGMQGRARIAYRRDVPVIDALYDVLIGRSEVRGQPRQGDT